MDQDAVQIPSQASNTLGEDMPDNIIAVLSRGNQELFHSAFIAWLLDRVGSHGLGDLFFRGLLPLLGCESATNLSTGYSVRREFRDRRSRFDILLVPDRPMSGSKGLVIENKINSFGSHLQLDQYVAQGYEVAALALLPETLDSEARRRYPVIEYRKVCEILQNLPLDASNGYQFVIDQYSSFLADTLLIFELLKEFGHGRLAETDFLSRLAKAALKLDYSDNDIRTLSYFYYFAFNEFLGQKAPDLIFGALDYNEAESQQRNTRWLFEKNMQGQPFMEALIYPQFEGNAHWRMHDGLVPIFETEAFQIAPRIELWLDPYGLTSPASQAGVLLLGTWSANLKKHLRSFEPYKSTLLRPGSRNVHRERVLVSDLPFAKLADRLRAILSKLFVVSPLGQNTH